MAGKNKTTALSPGHPFSGDRALRISPLPVIEIPRDTEGAHTNTIASASQHSEEITESSQHRITKTRTRKVILLLSSINTLKAYAYTVNTCERSLREDKKEQEIVAGSARMNENYKDCLHRMRREANIQNLTHRTHWNRPKQSDIPKEKKEKKLIRVKRYRVSKYEIKKSTGKKANTGANWTDARRKQHGDFMRNYWRTAKARGSTPWYKDQSILMKKYWKNLRKIGSTERFVQVTNQTRRYWKNLEEKMGLNYTRTIQRNRMLVWWKKQREDGSIKKISEDNSKFMKKIWKKEKAEGNTQRLKSISEALKAYWRRLKETGNTERNVQQRERIYRYHKKVKEEGRTRPLLSLKERMKIYWDNFIAEEKQEKERKRLRQRQRFRAAYLNSII
ncbi:hypothetical protein WDU94_003372 [Cyamophila willieti]